MRLLKRLLVLLCVVVLVVGGIIAWRLRPRQHHFFTDADTIKTPQEAAVVRKILWTPPTPLAETLNTAADDYEPHLSSDGRTLFFVRGKAGQNADIYVCLRTRDGWSEPAPLTAVNTEYDELGPELSADGRLLYFYSDRLGSLGGYDLWVSRLGQDGWRPATNLGPNANSPQNDYGPALSPDGTALYFSSNRPRPDDAVQPAPDAWPATLREQRHQHDYDLYASAVTDGGVGRAQCLSDLNTPFNDGAPAVSTYGDFLYFSSDRPGGFGGFDLYRSRRLRGRHQPSTNLGGTVNTVANELDPDLSLGGYALHFSSDRMKADPRPLAGAAERDLADGAQRPDDYNLYTTTSREVFRETETVEASINWAGLWKEIGPNVLLALLALLLTLLLLALLRDFRQRKLSLLARCLLASLLAHLLLMLLLNVVEVTTSLAHVLRGRGKIQVALLPSAAGDEIAGQIRGQWTQVDVPMPETSATPVPDITQHMESNDPTTTLVVEPLAVAMDERPTLPPPIDDAPLPKDVTSTPQAVDAPLPAEMPPPLDITGPTDAAPVDVVEAEAPARPIAAAALAEKGRPPAVPTTQPAVPVPEDKIEPAHVRRVALDDAPSRPTGGRTIDDAEPVSPTSDPFSRAAPRTEAVAPRLAELSMPTEEATRTGASRPGADWLAEPDEWVPAVNVAAAESVRPAADPALSSLLPREPSVAVERIRPVSSLQDWADASVRGEPDPPWRRAGPATPPLSVSESKDIEPVPATLNEIGLPPARTATAIAEHVDNRPPEVHAAQPDRVRRQPVLSSDHQGPAGVPADELVDVPPAGQGALVESAGSLVDLRHVPKDAETANLSIQRLGTSGASVVSEPLILELDLPAKFEPAGETTTVAEHADSRRSKVQAARPDRIRRQQVLSSGRQGPAGVPADELVDVSPARQGALVDLPGSLADTRRVPEDAKTANLPVQRPKPPATPVASGPVPLDVNLPTDLEPAGGREVPGHVIGTIHGRVSDLESGDPLPGAAVRLVLPDEQTLIATTNETGLYGLAVPPVPEFFALSASRRGYIPGTANISAAMLSGTPLRVDFRLPRQTDTIVAVEAEPDVHHLGNDLFEGRINSQFQKSSEGRSFRATFELSPDQLPPNYDRAEVWLMAKGVQCPHQIRINSRLVRDRLDHAPRDGSFGRFTARFDATWLEPGTNRIKITAVSCRGDLDDFEFVNLQIRLRP